MSENTRPWGHYEVLQDGPSHKVKCIYVLPGKRLSYQTHKFRAEHWFILSGDVEVTIDGKTFSVTAGQSIDIPIGMAHRIANIGQDEVSFIEVQTGTYFGEDDIVRLEDDFGR